jgi:hypothetical protein
MVAHSTGSYGQTMYALHIEHPITDYRTWRAAYDNAAGARREAGVVSERIASPVDDPHYVVVALDFDTKEQAAAFLHFLEANVWSSSASAPALAGRPRTALLELADA